MKRILIADDDAVNRSLILRQLGRNGKYQLRVSSSVADTRACCESAQIDLLIIDDLGGGGVAFGDERYRQGKPVIITSVAVTSQAGAPRIEKGSPTFLDDLQTKAAELLGE